LAVHGEGFGERLDSAGALPLLFERRRKDVENGLKEVLNNMGGIFI
jgi:hypothetical protein